MAKANERLKREIVERRKAEKEKEGLIVDLKKALSEVKKLSGLLPICASCKSIRTHEGEWLTPEEYFTRRYDYLFTHSFCGDCRNKLYPDFNRS